MPDRVEYTPFEMPTVSTIRKAGYKVDPLGFALGYTSTKNHSADATSLDAWFRYIVYPKPTKAAIYPCRVLVEIRRGASQASNTAFKLTQHRRIPYPASAIQSLYDHGLSDALIGPLTLYRSPHPYREGEFTTYPASLSRLTTNRIYAGHYGNPFTNSYYGPSIPPVIDACREIQEGRTARAN